MNSTTIARHASDSLPAASSSGNPVFRRMVFGMLEKVCAGEITICEGKTRTIFGSCHSDSDLRVEVRVRHPRLYRRLALGGDVGAGEAYMDGDWSCDNLTDLLRLFARQVALMDATSDGL
jgi:cyclopropane-fatty-acyl-phospholipid synthase